MPSVLEVYTFPRLRSAKRDEKASQVDYKSGASFSGSLDGVRRSGSGVFAWPNGDRYAGGYVENVRQGKGEQLWADGSHHVGMFEKDVRHGYGETRWRNGESYVGSYFKDHRHGEGVYSWADGSTFQGTFYKDRKEGYGVFNFASGKKFEGLYRNDERCGPGVLTYPDNTQDVGLWHKERLINLCSPTESAFHLDDHEHIDYNNNEHVNFVRNPHNSRSRDRKSNAREDCLTPEVGSGDASSSFKEASTDLKLPGLNDETHQESVDLHTLTYDQQDYDAAFFGDGLGACDEVPEEEDVRLENNTPSYVKMQEHILLHRHRESSMPFAVSGILEGDRGCHGDKGPIEMASEALIVAAGSGDYETANELLRKGAADVNVSDRDGHTALLGAAVNMHKDIINLLLDNGADVNKLNNEGLSALAACNVLFYPPDAFKYNIAERYLPQPTEDLTNGSPGDGNDLGPSMDGLNLDDRSQMSDTTQDLLSVPSHETGGTFSNNHSSVDLPDHFQSEDDDNHEDLAGDSGHDLGERVSKDSRIKEGDDFFDVESHVVTEDPDMKEDTEIPEWDPETAVSESRFGTVEEEESGRQPSIIHEPEDTATESEGETDSHVERDTYSLPEFDSNTSLVNYRMPVTEEMIERCATVMSHNKGITSGRSSKCSDQTIDEARRRAIAKAEHAEMESTIRLLLRRGADPNASDVPLPVLFFAIKATDVDAVRVLLEKGATTSSRLSKEKDGLTPLHIASALHGREGVDITRLVLEAGADPNTRTLEDDTHEKIDFSLDTTSPAKARPGLDDSVLAIYDEVKLKGNHEGGRSALHIACSRDDDYELSRQVVRLLLESGADPNVLCNGQSPLSLAIASGNDPAVSELLQFGANPSLPLGAQYGSALCVASDTQYEHRREPLQRIALIDKLVNAGANILAPIPVGSKKQMGTAVDYAYWKFNQDRRIAHMPYHALTNTERDTYNARRRLLGHLGGILRMAAVQRERERLDHEALNGIRSKSPTHDFLYTGAGARPIQGLKTVIYSSDPGSSESLGALSGSKQVIFHSQSQDDTGHVLPLVDKESMPTITRKPLLKYCYECGRMLGVRLSVCTRCKEVYYCSKACKVRGWNARHKEECLRVTERSRSPSPNAKTMTDGRRGTRTSNRKASGASSNKILTGGRSGIKSGRTSDGGKSADHKRRGSATSTGSNRVLKAGSVESRKGQRSGGLTSQRSLGGDSRGSAKSNRGGTGASPHASKGGSAGTHGKAASVNESGTSHSNRDISENYSFN